MTTNSKEKQGLILIPVVVILMIVFLAGGTSAAMVLNEKRKYTRETAMNTSCGNTTLGNAGDLTFTFPDKSKAVRHETRHFYITSYCPPATGYHRIEGGQTTSSGIHVGFGSVAVPPFNHSNPDITSSTPDYPWGTLFEIPGYGTGAAMDHGCAIQKANTPASCKSTRWPQHDIDHLDVFVGNGSAACNAWPTKKDVAVEVYWFDQARTSPYDAKDVRTWLKPVTKTGESVATSTCSANGATSTATGVCGERVLSVAKQEVEKNIVATRDCSPYQVTCQPWCAAFVSWVYKQAGFLKSIHPGTVNLREDTSELTVIKTEGDINKVAPGDIFWQSTSQASSGWHVGIVEMIGNGYIYTIEGNVGKVGNTDKLARRKHKISDIQYVARPKSCS